MLDGFRQSILIVDDEKAEAERVSHDFEEAGYSARVVTTGEEAVSLVLQWPDDYDLALIDEKLHPDGAHDPQSSWDGIRTAREILKINKHIGTVVYSNKVGSKEEEREALKRGVHRYIYKRGVPLIQFVRDFMTQMEQLGDLANRLEAFAQIRNRLGSLIAGLEVGNALIDRKFRVWYADDRYSSIMGYPTIEQGLCYKEFHGYEYDPCCNCPVKKAFGEANKHHQYMLNPRQVGGLRYVYTEASPVHDESGNVIAVIKSVVEIDEREILAAKSLEEHIQLILQSLYERGRNTQRGYGVVALYQTEKGKKDALTQKAHLKLSASKEQGRMETVALAESVEREVFPTEKELLAKKGIPGLSSLPTIVFPLGSARWLVVTRESSDDYPLERSDVATILDYANLLATIIKSRKKRKNIGSKFKARAAMLPTRLELAQVAEPIRGLELLLNSAMKRSKAEMGHIRILVGGRHCRLIVWKGEYASRAPESIDVRIPRSATAQTVNSEAPQVFNDIRYSPEDSRRYFSISPEDPLARRIKSIAIFPLMFEGTCLGIMKLMSKRTNLFLGEVVEFLKELCPWGGLLLRDYRLELLRKEPPLQELARRAAHKVGSPVASLRNYLRILSDEPSRTREIVPLAMRQLQRIEALADDMERILNPIPPLQETVSVSDLVKHVVESLIPAHPGVLITSESQEPELKIRVDRNSLTEAVEELIHNALKAGAETRGLSIHVRIESSAASAIDALSRRTIGRFVLIRVSDNGPGVPEEVKDRIFQPGVTTSSSSSGLGLSIVRRIIEQNGGEIFLEKTDKPGSTFCVAMPMYEE